MRFRSIIKSFIAGIVFAIVLAIGFVIGFAIGSIILVAIPEILLLVIILLGALISSYVLVRAKPASKLAKVPSKRQSTLEARINKKKITNGDEICVNYRFSNLVRKPEITYIEGIFRKKRAQYQYIKHYPDSNGILIIFEKNKNFKLKEDKEKVQPLLFNSKKDINFLLEFYFKNSDNNIKPLMISLKFKVINISHRILLYLGDGINNISKLNDNDVEELLSLAKYDTLFIRFIFAEAKENYWNLIQERFDYKVF